MLDLTEIPVVDQHAHPLLRPDEIASFTYAAAFTEAYDAEVIARHTPETLFFKRSMREIAAVLGCDPDPAAVLAARQRVSFDDLAQRFIGAGHFEALLLDDGYWADRTLPVVAHGAVARPYRLLRVESLAEQLIGEAASWTEFEERFRAALRQPGEETVGLKSIVAYRTGLRVEGGDREAAAACFQVLRTRAEAGDEVRLAAKPFNDWVVRATLEVAAERGTPVQFHTGFGDPDLDLRLANSLYLRPLLEDPSFHRVPIVLLHGSYPFTREAGYLAAVYPNVHVDLGLAIPSLSVDGMASVVRGLLEIAPLSKILFSTDARLIPELFYLGARWGRRLLGQELERAVGNGDLTATEAEVAARDILRENAIRLYGL